MPARILIMILILTGLLSLSGCFFVSKSEVLKRVRSALPNVEITTDVFEVNSTCFLTSFNVHQELSAKQVLESSALASFDGLGKRWMESHSFAHSLDSPDSELPDSVKLGINHAIIAAKPCLDKANLTLHDIEYNPVIFTFSPYGSSVIFFLKHDMTKFYYLVET